MARLLVTFAGGTAAGAVSVAGTKAGDSVVVVSTKDGDISVGVAAGIDFSTGFAKLVFVDGELYQSANSDLSSVQFTALFEREALV